MSEKLRIVKTSKDDKFLGLYKDGDDFQLSTLNLEGKYDVSILHDPSIKPVYSQCISVITDPVSGSKAQFFHQLSGNNTREDDPEFDWADNLIQNLRRMLRILSFMKSLTNDQCKQMINEQKKKSN